MKIEGSESAFGSGSESGSISQRHGSADPDPDPHQNVMDPQHHGLWLSNMSHFRSSSYLVLDACCNCCCNAVVFCYIQLLAANINKTHS
jgi:hypothetical protein